jgi:gliding motility-associated-like protein
MLSIKKIMERTILGVFFFLSFIVVLNKHHAVAQNTFILRSPSSTIIYNTPNNIYSNPNFWRVWDATNSIWAIAANSPSLNDSVIIDLDSLDVHNSDITVNFGLTSNRLHKAMYIRDISPNDGNDYTHAFTGFGSNFIRLNGSFVAKDRYANLTAMNVELNGTSNCELSLYFDPVNFPVHNVVTNTPTGYGSEVSRLGILKINKTNTTNIVLITSPVIAQNNIQFLKGTIEYNNYIQTHPQYKVVRCMNCIVNNDLELHNNAKLNNLQDAIIWSGERIILQVDDASDNLQNVSIRGRWINYEVNNASVPLANIQNQQLVLNNGGRLNISKNAASNQMPHFKNMYLLGSSNIILPPSLWAAPNPIVKIDSLRIYKGLIEFFRTTSNASTVGNTDLEVNRIIDASNCATPVFIRSRSFNYYAPINIKLNNSVTLNNRISFENVRFSTSTVTTNGEDLGGNVNIIFNGQQSATFIWNPINGNSWHEPSNWLHNISCPSSSSSAIPSLLDSVVIPNSTILPVVSEPAFCRSITFNNNNTSSTPFTLNSSFWVNGNFVVTASDNSRIITTNNNNLSNIYLLGRKYDNSRFAARQIFINGSSTNIINLIFASALPSKNNTYTFTTDMDGMYGAIHFLSGKMVGFDNSWNDDGQSYRTIRCNYMISTVIPSAAFGASLPYGLRDLDITNSKLVLEGTSIGLPTSNALEINYRYTIPSVPLSTSDFKVTSDPNTTLVDIQSSFVSSPVNISLKLDAYQGESTHGNWNHIRFSNPNKSYILNTSNGNTINIIESWADLYIQAQNTPAVMANKFKFTQGYTYRFLAKSTNTLVINDSIIRLPNVNSTCAFTKFYNHDISLDSINPNNIAKIDLSNTYAGQSPNPLDNMEINKVRLNINDIIYIDNNSTLTPTSLPGWSVSNSSSTLSRKIYYWIGEGATPNWTDKDNWSLYPPTLGDDTSATCLPGKEDIVVFANDSAFPSQYPLLNSSTQRYQSVMDQDFEVHTIIWGNNPHLLNHLTNTSHYLSAYISTCTNGNYFLNNYDTILQPFTKNPLFHTTVVNGTTVSGRSNSRCINVLSNQNYNFDQTGNRRLTLNGSCYYHRTMQAGQNSTNALLAVDCPVLYFTNKLSQNQPIDYVYTVNSNLKGAINSSIVFDPEFDDKTYVVLDSLTITLTSFPPAFGGIMEGIFHQNGKLIAQGIPITTPGWITSSGADTVNIQSSNITLTGFQQHSAGNKIGCWTYASNKKLSLLADSSQIMVQQNGNWKTCFLNYRKYQKYHQVFFENNPNGTVKYIIALFDSTQIRHMKIKSNHPSSANGSQFFIGNNSTDYNITLTSPPEINGLGKVWIDTLELLTPQSYHDLSPGDTLYYKKLFARSTPCNVITIQTRDFSGTKALFLQDIANLTPPNQIDASLITAYGLAINNINSSHGSNGPGPYTVYGSISNVVNTDNWQVDTNASVIGFGLAPSYSTTCSQLPFNLSTNFWGDNFTTYQWSNNQNTPNAVFQESGTYTITVNYNNGCQITQSTQIQVQNDLNTVDSISHVTCNGLNNGYLEINSLINASPNHTYQYTWNTGSTNVSISNLSPGNYTVTIQSNQSPNDCRITRSFTITEPPLLQLSSTVQNNVCANVNTASIDITPQGGTPVYTYSWSNLSTSEDLSGLANGTYTVTLTDANSCSTSATFTISSPPAIQADSTVQHVTCYGLNNGQISFINTTGGVSPYQYSIGSGYSSSSVFNNLTPGTYNLTIQDNNNCTYSLGQVTITEPAALQWSIDANSTDTVLSCHGDTDGMIGVLIQGGIQPYTYNWSSNPSGNGSGYVTNLGAGTYALTLTDSNNCVLTTSFQVTEPPLLQLTLNNINPDDCNVGNSSGAINFQITGGTPSYDYDVINTTTNQTYHNQSSNLAAGVYQVYVTDTNGCMDSLQNIVINSLNGPTLSSSITDVTCAGLQNGDIQITAQPSGGTYQWFDANNNMLGNNSSITNLSGGMYVVVYNLNGCISSDTLQVLEPDSLQANYLVNSVTCHQGSDGSIAQQQIQGGVSPYQYAWSNGENAPSVQNLSAGSYQVSISDNNGCTLSLSFTVTEPSALNIAYTTEPNRCHNDSTGSIMITSPNESTLYSVSWNNNAYQGFTLSNLPAGTYQAYIINTQNQCRDSVTVVLANPDSIIVELVSETIPQCKTANGSITIQVSNANEPYTIEWPLPLVGSGNTGYGIAHNTTYEINVTDDKGCRGRMNYITPECTPEDSLYIPQFFSPNADGKNDVWEILGLDFYPNLKVQIFNRWGSLVYEKDPYDNTWDGTPNVNLTLGKDKLPPGTYFYHVDVYGDGTLIYNSFVEIRP